jgi:hypothetical protein
MREDTVTLAEMMLSAEQFCSKVETAAQDLAPTPEQEDLRLKLNQCRTLLIQLQALYDEDELTIENAAARAGFRHLVMALLWAAFGARRVIDFKTFRKVVMIESSFTYLLTSGSQWGA